MILSNVENLEQYFTKYNCIDKKEYHAKYMNIRRVSFAKQTSLLFYVSQSQVRLTQ